MITTVKLGGPIQSSPPFLFFGLGSCFVQNLAAPLDKINIPYLFNPLGTSFNPISIARQLEWLLDPKATFNPAYFHSGVYHQLDAANKFQNINEAALNQSIE
ncbi:MAG: GSCFA domain-containing protein, partial [Schleiferiaceae bacterium]|nr:GSCFA domain-containing protein [Schleiferiaceae bacterium]